VIHVIDERTQEAIAVPASFSCNFVLMASYYVP